jgi:hypothetical protein
MSANAGAPAPEIPGVELTGVIGSGGSGIVYLGRQTAFGRDVAVKVTSRGAAPDESTRRWEREVAAIGRLSNHPNIVPVFDAGITAGGSPYIVMPYVPQGTLGDRLRDEGPMPPEEVATIGAKLAGTLATVHAAGVLHRDVKPENVLWSPHGEPQLTDFGIARLQDITTTMAGGLHATIAYAAPEILAGKAATEGADVYGLGATLYACVTGGSPHPTGGGESVAALVAKVIEQGPPPLTGTDVPAPLAAVIDRAMSREPSDRQVSADELRRELEQARTAILAGPPDTAEHPTGVDDTRVQAAVAPPLDPPTSRQHVSVPAPAPTPPPAREPVREAVPAGAGGGTGNRGLWVVALVVVVLFVGLLALALTRDDDPDDSAVDASDEPATETTDTAAATTDPTTTEAPSTTTTEAATTTEPAQGDRDGGDESSSGDISDAAVRYIRTLDRGELEEAWALTSARFQANQDRDQWEGFWGSYDDISIVGDPRADADSGTVVVPLSLDGQREDYAVELVRQGGRWLVDGPVGR